MANSAPDSALDWVLERDFILGGKDEGPESFYRLTASAVGADGQDNIYVLDMDQHSVAVFDARGSSLRSMGREGNGPGELAWPIGLSVSREGVVSVLDLGNAGFVRFAPDGSVLDKAAMPIGREGTRYIDLDSVSVYTVDATERSTAESITSKRLAVASSDDTVTLAELEVPASGMIDLKSCGIGFSGMPQLFAPSIVWDARGDVIAASSSVEYQIEVFEGTRKVRSIRRDIEPQPTTTDMARAELGDGMRVTIPSGVRECDSDEVIEKRGVAPVLQAVRDIRIAPDGTVWVSRSGLREQKTPTDVFGADGEYIGTLPPSIQFPAMFLSDGRMLVIEQDEMGVDRLFVYRVERV